MLSIPSLVKVFLHVEPVNLHYGFDRLSALAREEMGQDPLSGHLFVFRNRRGDRVKLLFWDADGLVIYYKELESGYARFFLFTGFGRKPHNLARWPVAAGGMDSSLLKSGPRRRPMSRE